MFRPIPSSSLEAAIRNHFGLTQLELARYLGITRGQVAHLEAGRRLPTPVQTRRLMPLIELLPPPEGHGAAAPVVVAAVLPAGLATALLTALPGFGPLLPGPVGARQRIAAAQAAALRWSLHRQTKRTAQQSRQWGLAVLRAALPQMAIEAAERTHIEQWIQTLAADVAAATATPAATTAHALAVLRILVLEVEVAALDQLLSGTLE